MEKILSRLFGFLKYILLIVAFGLVFYGLMVTLGRLEKPITDGVEYFIPFGVLLILFIINLFINSKKYISDNLLFNFVSCLIFSVIIIICLRAKFDINMILYHKYNIHFNPAYFSDNLSLFKTMLYMLSLVDILFIICHFVDKKDKKIRNNNVKNVNVSFSNNIDVVNKEFLPNEKVQIEDNE